MDLGIYLGCCISELCNLKKKYVVVDDGIIVINIERGKIKVVICIVFLFDVIGERLLVYIENKEDDDFVIGIGSKIVSWMFFNFKIKYVIIDGFKIFYLFRYMYIIVMECVGVEENIIV